MKPNINGFPHENPNTLILSITGNWHFSPEKREEDRKVIDHLSSLDTFALFQPRPEPEPDEEQD